MKLVSGESGEDLLQREGERRDLRRHTATFQAVCNAVSFAHDRGILHRDLKPRNVMVGEFGQVFFMDWGLAVAVDDGTCEQLGVRHVRDVRTPAGTPSYMAPVLASGDGARQDERTDVYLLGACLHRVLTGRLRHGGATLTDVLVSALDRMTRVMVDHALATEDVATALTLMSRCDEPTEAARPRFARGVEDHVRSPTPLAARGRSPARAARVSGGPYWI